MTAILMLSDGVDQLEDALFCKLFIVYKPLNSVIHA